MTEFVILGALVIVVAWIALPFAMFGIKPLLREIRDELQRINRMGP